MKETDAPRPVRELEPPPTMARPTEEEPTILARWLSNALERGPIFWVLLGGLAVVFTGLWLVTSSLMAAKSTTGQAWIDSVPARSPEDQLKIADANPRTPVADWLRLQAASEEYRVGLEDLTAPGKRESAGPRLKRALDLFGQVAKEAPIDSPQARGASFAVARVLETRNELPEAIKQYRLVAETWKDSPEARASIAYARALENPEAIQFYKDLYTTKTPGSFDPLGGFPDIPPPPGMKPGDLLSPGAPSPTKPGMPDLNGPIGIDPPPASPTPVPAPTPAPAAAPTEKPADASLPTPFSPPAASPAANPPK